MAPSPPPRACSRWSSASTRASSTRPAIVPASGSRSPAAPPGTQCSRAARLRLESAEGEAGRPAQRRRGDLAAYRRRRARRDGGLPCRPAEHPPQPAPRRRVPGRHQRRPQAGRLRFARAETSVGGSRYVEAGAGATGAPAARAGRAPRPRSSPPSRRSAGLAPRDRDRPPRLRRLRQAARGAPTTRATSPAAVVGALDALELDAPTWWATAMGGRVAIEVGLRHPEPRRAARCCWPRRWPGWRDRPWARYLRCPARAGPAPARAAPGRRADRAPDRARRVRTAGRPRAWTSSCAPT